MKERFSDDGFVIVEDLVPDDLIRDAAQDIRRVLEAEASRNLNVDISPKDSFDKYLVKLFNLDGDYRGRLYELLQDMSSLYSYAACSRLLKVAQDLGMGAPNVRNAGTRIDIPGENEFLQPLHQDVNSMRTENCLNFWIPLQSVIPENGALRVFSGSHEIGPVHAEEKELNKDGYESIPLEIVEDYPEIHCTIDPTDVVVFHPYLVHGSETNRSDQIRWTVIVRYDDASKMDWLIDGANPHAELRREDAA